VQGVDISYSIGRAMSMVENCTIAGVREGIVTHSSEVSVMNNRILQTTQRGISLGEMSMGMASGNEVSAALGVGILCEDHSMCEIEHNTIAGTRVDGSADRARQGIAIESNYFAQAKLRHNTVIASPGGIQAFDNSVITR
jgi:parallel beta-helix repeat protein